MSFQILNVEPAYDYVTESYKWIFYNIIQLKQYQLINGNIKYVLSIGLNSPETFFTTENKEPSKKEFKELSRELTKVIWKHLNEIAQQANSNFNNFNDYALKLEKEGLFKKE